MDAHESVAYLDFERSPDNIIDFPTAEVRY